MKSRVADVGFGMILSMLVYIISTLTSYTLVICDMPIEVDQVVFVLACGGILSLSMLIILLHSSSMAAILIRSAASLVGLPVTILVFAYTGLLRLMEKYFSVGKMAQNLEGLLSLFFIAMFFLSVVLSVLVGIFKIKHIKKKSWDGSSCP